ncbi:secondary thiamine-phosphate synthase enzyme YjbQ [Desulfurispirillum indicum]|uniref:secondary thiamine-phosphate synthase enzyme YjbQ n=1 Tax=Desulfurispirillum indicum TaxID=936456 RepID=UPI001CFB0AEC|nr:secondary thiamine-phosphate synthase enzyme YjbQ [Desulfurispirillum indicum]UCZ56824.1 secondary thiamine-phosphate synthase enzyme YjbQ [Desulfurispirillum indicum]
MHVLTLHSHERTQFIEMTHSLHEAVRENGWKDGILLAFTPHTTAALTINENADPDVAVDLQHFLKSRIPADPSFRHMEGNSDAHIKSSLLGCSAQMIVARGALQLGTWQGLYFCEFDGPRQRQVYLQFCTA